MPAKTLDPKKYDGLKLSEQQVDDLICMLKDEYRYKYEEIYDFLEATGYVSRRTGEPLAAATIRFRHLNVDKQRAKRAKTSKQQGQPAEAPIVLSRGGDDCEQLRATIRAVVGMAVPPEHKIKFIEQLLSS